MEESEHFYQLYVSFSDAQIIDILKNKSSYRDKALTEAIHVAIERGLINSEQDLMSPQYQLQDKSRFSLFPEISDRYQREKLTRSVSRIIYMVTLIPLINAALDYSKGDDKMGLNLFIAIAWASLSILNDKFSRSIYFYLQIVYTLMIGFWYAIQLFNFREVNYTDLIILFIGLLIMLYLLIYHRKLKRIPV
jgi:hypothetical protein